jgi:MFS family permease
MCDGGSRPTGEAGRCKYSEHGTAALPSPDRDDWTMAFQPAPSLKNKTFIGLIIAQFLAGFNDQAIHAMAMFYAIHTSILTEADAITLMPILFFAPWAIFCTLAGYLADRFSKTYTLRAWKITEVGIALVLILGFYLGTSKENPLGAWIVMSTVFMMGTHAAFFAPAKYGAMPEMLQAHILSRGNGILESTTFLASILGTVFGGLLSFYLRHNEIWIGVCLLVLSVIGAAASFLIAYLPPGNPTRAFPINLFKPLIDNLKVLFRSRPLALAVIGIAFFVFMVAYMRATMYMHGQSRNPRWDELKTSLVVAVVALGVGAGSPLAGYFSGGKIELGLVPLGCVGMIIAALVAGVAIESTAVLVVSLIALGFFSGFYMVPLYTLLQHRAPKACKGDLVATSNFINVTGAIAASLLFNALVQVSQLTGITPAIRPVEVATGTLEELKKDDHGKVVMAVVRTADQTRYTFHEKKLAVPPLELPEDYTDDRDFVDQILDIAIRNQDIEFEEDLFEIISGGLKPGDEVAVTQYDLRGVRHFRVRAANRSPKLVYDYEYLPRYLFIGAALMTLGILLLLTRKLPDFFVRTFFWLWSLGRMHIREVGLKNLPTNGPVVLATNCENLRSGLILVSVTDRTTKVLLPAGYDRAMGIGILRTLAPRTTVIEMPPATASAADWDSVRRRAEAALADGHLLAVAVDGPGVDGDLQAFVTHVRQDTQAPIVPVFCGALDPAEPRPRVRVVFGQQAKAGAGLAEVRAEIDKLGDWIRHNDDTAGAEEQH